MTLLNLYKLAERNNIEVDSFRFDKIEALSICDDSHNCHVAIDPFKLKSKADEKSKLAHELGHCMTGSFYNRNNIYDLREKHEAKADRWAIKTLMPYLEIMQAIKRGYKEPYTLAEYFDLPQQAVEDAITYYKEAENKSFND